MEGAPRLPATITSGWVITRGRRPISMAAEGPEAIRMQDWRVSSFFARCATANPWWSGQTTRGYRAGGCGLSYQPVVNFLCGQPCVQQAPYQPTIGSLLAMHHLG